MNDVFDTNKYSPISHVKSVLLDRSSVSLYVKREDFLHPTISGNKWRKLKYNLKDALADGVETIVTFGGAFSNHIYATAAACHELGLKSVGIIRGEYDKHNPTTKFAKRCGMELRFVERSDYREKENSDAVKSILSEYSNYILIPEGGSNDQAIKGLHELSIEINASDHNIIMVSAGTGSTASGILQNLDSAKELWVFSSIKSEYLKDEILSKTDPTKHCQLKFISNYHYGGYGKTPPELIRLINDFKAQTEIPIDPIYNGKLIAGFSDMIEKGKVNNNHSYLWIHTGGLQGIDSYNYMAEKKKWPEIDK
ncbi:MAG: 1-aminocyclopropane-1-carboxylate deaminase [Saprospiraceae bacterium]